MTMHANMHPDEGADDRATNLGGADVTNCNVDGGRKHPPHTLNVIHITRLGIGSWL